MTYAIPEQFSAANKANIDALITFANTAFAGTERLTALNLGVARSALEDAVGNAKTLLSVKDATELASLPASLCPPAMEKVIAYSRSLYEIASQTKDELDKVFEAQCLEVNKNLSSVLNQAGSNAPAGAEATVAAVKSAMAAVYTAYDNMNKAAKQAAEIAETVTGTTAKTTAKASKKAA